MFNQEDFGKPISQELSDKLKEHTTNIDQANVSGATGVGTSTIRGVIYRNNSLTESNSVAIVELTKIAIKNCEKTIEDSTRVKEELEMILSNE